MSLADKLKHFDLMTEERLQEPYRKIEERSKALANSLRRCFEEARSSRRFEYAHQIGLSGQYQGLAEEELLKLINEKFEEQDFTIFREFVRLLRACSLHIGGETSAQIRDCYNQTFKEDRVIIAYNEGLREFTK